MATYCYRSEDGRITDTVERRYSETVPKYIVRRGVKLHRDYQAESVTPPPPGNWPMESDAAGVSPCQAQEAYEESVATGTPTVFDRETGCAIFESPKHRKAFCEAHALYDRNAGYSDPTPKTR